MPGLTQPSRVSRIDSADALPDNPSSNTDELDIRSAWLAGFARLWPKSSEDGASEMASDSLSSQLGSGVDNSAVVVHQDAFRSSVRSDIGRRRSKRNVVHSLKHVNDTVDKGESSDMQDWIAGVFGQRIAPSSKEDRRGIADPGHSHSGHSDADAMPIQQNIASSRGSLSSELIPSGEASGGLFSLWHMLSTDNPGNTSSHQDCNTCSEAIPSSADRLRGSIDPFLLQVDQASGGGVVDRESPIAALPLACNDAAVVPREDAESSTLGDLWNAGLSLFGGDSTDGVDVARQTVDPDAGGAGGLMTSSPGQMEAWSRPRAGPFESGAVRMRRHSDPKLIAECEPSQTEGGAIGTDQLENAQPAAELSMLSWLTTFPPLWDNALQHDDDNDRERHGCDPEDGVPIPAVEVDSGGEVSDSFVLERGLDSEVAPVAEWTPRGPHEPPLLEAFRVQDGSDRKDRTAESAPGPCCTVESVTAELANVQIGEGLPEILGPKPVHAVVRRRVDLANDVLMQSAKIHKGVEVSGLDCHQDSWEVVGLARMFGSVPARKISPRRNNELFPWEVCP